MGRQTIDLDPVEVRPALRLLSQVEKMRPGLGFPLVWISAARIGAALGGGRGVFAVGKMGAGKAALLYGSRLPGVLGVEVEAPGELHPRWLASHLKALGDKGEDTSRLTITLEDLAPVSGSRYKLERILNAGAWGVSDRRFSDKGWGGRSASGLADVFDGFFMGCGMTPKVLGNLTRLAPWGDMWRDRYTTFALIRRARDNRRITAAMRSIPHEEVAQVIADYLPAELYKPEIEADPGLMAEVEGDLYRVQHTEDRSPIYMAQDLRGLAVLCGSDAVTDDHVRLLSMAAPYIHLGAMSPGVIEITQHGALGEEIPEGRAVLMGRVAQDMRARASRLGGHLHEARDYGLLEYWSPTGKTGAAQIWLGGRLGEQLHNIDRLSRWGARFGG